MASTKLILVTWPVATVALLVLLVYGCNVLTSPSYDAEKLGEELLNKQDYQAAIIALDRAISLDPKNAAAHSNRGLAYWYLGQHQKAIEDFNGAITALDQSIKLDPKNEMAYVSRCEVYSCLGQYEKELDDSSKLIELAPWNAEYYVMRAGLNDGLFLTNNRRELCQKAIDDYSKAIRLNPFHVQAYVGRSAAYYQLGNLALAVEDCKRARTLGYSGSGPFY